MAINSAPVDQAAFTRLMLVEIEPKADRDTGVQFTSKDGSERRLVNRRGVDGHPWPLPNLTAWPVATAALSQVDRNGSHHFNIIGASFQRVAAITSPTCRCHTEGASAMRDNDGGHADGSRRAQHPAT